MFRFNILNFLLWFGMFWHVSFRFGILANGLVCFGMFWHVWVDVPVRFWHVLLCFGLFGMFRSALVSLQMVWLALTERNLLHPSEFLASGWGGVQVLYFGMSRNASVCFGMLYSALVSLGIVWYVLAC